MTGLGSVKIVPLRLAALLLPRKAGAETTSGIRAAGCAVALAARPVLLIIAPIGLGLLCSGQ